MLATVDELETAWTELHEVNARLGWEVGLPAFYERRGEWQLYAFDPAERPRVGRRSREWTAVAPTQAGVVREMARVLAEINAGRAPR